MARVSPAKYGNHKWPQKMPIATLDQAPPVQNTWYTLISGIKNVEIGSLQLYQSNDEAAAKDVEMSAEIGGVAVSYVANSCNNASWGASYLNAAQDKISKAFGTTWLASAYYNIVKAKTASIRIRLTSAAGTNQVLRARVQYRQFSEVANP